MLYKENYYQVLGLSKDASTAEIKKAARRLQRKYHPDVNLHDKTAEDKFIQVEEARAILTDEKKRAIFDHYGYYVDKLEITDPPSAPSELNEPVWAIVNGITCYASELTYDECMLRAKQHPDAIIVAGDAAARLN